MKTSLLLATAVLSSLMMAQSALAAEGAPKQAPPLAPIQIVQAGAVTGTIATPVAPAKAVAPVKGSAQEQARQKALDESALAHERKAESEFKAEAKPGVPSVAKPVAVVGPRAPVAPKAVVKAPTKPPVKPVVKAAADKKADAKPLVAQAQAAPAAAPVATVKIAGRSVVLTKGMDAAGLLAARCATFGKKALKCMNYELNESIDRVDAIGTKILNCGEVLSAKAPTALEAQEVKASVLSRYWQAHEQAVAEYKAEVAQAGAISKIGDRQIALRATLKQLKTLNALARNTCEKAGLEAPSKWEAAEAVPSTAGVVQTPAAAPVAQAAVPAKADVPVAPIGADHAE